MTEKHTPTVSLVLGSGGARGLTHIGIIDWLEENGFKIEAIAGCSMGALIGGFYAAGKLDTYTAWVRELNKTDVIRYLDLSYGGPGLFKGERIIKALQELIGEHNIEDLPIAFTAVATDIENGKECWLNEGPLFDAIRASMAVPTLFTPYEYKGRKLVDGGLVNPVPIAPTFQNDTDLTIAVTLHATPDSTPKLFEKPKSEKALTETPYRKRITQFIDELQKTLTPKKKGNMGVFDIVLRSFDTMQNTIARLKLAAYSPDVIIEIPKDISSTYEFYRAEELIELGKQKAEETLSQYLSEET